jgi:hypothetical protein
VTVYYSANGNTVTLFSNQVTGTSTDTSFTLTGLPSALYPARNLTIRTPQVGFVDNGTATWADMSISSAGLISFAQLNSSYGAISWTASGTKTCNGFSCTYLTN